MDIVLDSNIFRADILLRSKEFDILNDYLEKTESRFILPQIIYDEIKGLYKRLILERLNDLKKAKNNVNLLLTDRLKVITDYNIDIDKELNNYVKFFKSRLFIDDDSIIPYENNYLPEIIKRAINREKPSGESGQGFRDVLIWLTIIDYAATAPRNQIAFISSNVEDFANSDKTTLHYNLVKECEDSGIKVNYYSSIKEFIENNSTKIGFINLEWIREKLEFKIISKKLNEELSGRESLMHWFLKRTGNECTGYFKIENITPSETLDYSVYEMLDGSYVINISLECNVEIEFEYFKDIFSSKIYYDNYEMERDSRVSSTLMQDLDLELYLSISVKNDSVIDTDLTDWFFSD